MFSFGWLVVQLGTSDTGGGLQSAVGPAALCVPQGGGVFSGPAKQWFANRTEFGERIACCRLVKKFVLA
jgi:hypothetical protein